MDLDKEDRLGALATIFFIFAISFFFFALYAYASDPTHAFNVKLSSDFNATSSIDNVLPFTDKVFDIGNDFSTATGTYKFTAPIAGYYLLGFQAYFNDTQALKTYEGQIIKNGTDTLCFEKEIQSDATYPQVVRCSVIVSLAQNDYAQVLVKHNSDATKTILSNAGFTFFFGEYLEIGSGGTSSSTTTNTMTLSTSTDQAIGNATNYILLLIQIAIVLFSAYIIYKLIHG